MDTEASIYILNFFWVHDNFGAILTAYALQSVIPKEYSSLLVDTKDKNYLVTTKKNINLEYFKNKYLKCTSKTFSSYNDFININNNEKIFITGSDQVFRNSKGFKYLLNFINIDNKKIAFSASFGLNKEQFLKENTRESIEHMKNSLKTFDFISIREKSGVEICKDILGVEAEWIIDPVFILEKENYHKLIENSTNNYKNKIVAYILDSNKDYKKAYKYLSKKYNKGIVETANSNISVENWLASIMDCDLFLTDSFHGMCFAIIFNKPFICLANKFRGKTRFDSICKMLKIENQCIDSITEIMQKDCVFKINYEKINQNIEKERKRGLNFLRKALETPIQITSEKFEARMKYLESIVLELEEQNNLSYQLKKIVWEKWLVIYHCYLPKPIKKIIRCTWHTVTRGKNARRK